MARTEPARSDDTGAPRVFTVPVGHPFLDRLAEAILTGNLPREGGQPPTPIELPGWQVILPTRRACRALQEALLRASRGRAMLLPRIRPIAEGDETASLIFDARGKDPHVMAADLPPAIGTLERRLVLTKLVMSWSAALRQRSLAEGTRPHAHARSPAQAARLAADLAAMMDAVETEEADVSRLADLVSPEFSEHWQLTLDFLKIITRFWPQHLAESGRLSPADRRNRLIVMEAQRLIAVPPSAPVIVAGVTGSVPATARLMRAVAQLPQGAIVLPGLDLTLPDDAWGTVVHAPAHPQYRLSRLIHTLGITRNDVRVLPGTATLPEGDLRARFIGEAMRPPAVTTAWQTVRERLEPDAVRAALAGVTCLEAASAEEEAEAVALILRQAAEVPGRTAALVTPDRNLGRRVAVRLESWGIKVDDSAGRPFAKTVPGAFLDLVVAAFESDFAPAPLMALLKHPLTRLGRSVAEARRSARTLELLAFRRPHLGRGLPGIRAALALDTGEADDTPWQPHRALRLVWPDQRLAAHVLLDALEAAFAPLVTLADCSRQHGLATLATAHAAVAEALARDEAGSSAALWAGEAGEAAAALLAALMDPSLPQPELAANDYPEFYRALVAGEAIRPLIPTHPRIFIWGPFESRLQQTDVMVIGSLNDGDWPELAEPDAWLNRPMLAELGLPQPETRIGDLAHDFTQLIGAPRVYLTRATKIDGVPKVPSRWLMRMRAVLAGLGIADALAPDPAEPWLAWARNRDATGPRLQIAAPEPRPPAAQRPRQLSVTRIEQWIANPYAIFARDIMRFEPMPRLGAAPDAALRGAVIHRALNRFALRFPDALPQAIVEQLEQDLREALQEFAAAPRVAAFWLPRFARFAQWFAETEPQRREGVVRLETEKRGALLLAEGHRPFTLTARADRLDVLADGSLVITDYKTGEPPADKQVVGGQAPQLPLEAAIALAGGFQDLPAAPVSGLRYIQAGGGNPPGAEHRVKIDDIARLAREQLFGLSRLIALFDQERTPYRALRRPGHDYRYDDYAHLARVKEWMDGAEDGDDGEA